MKLVRKIKILLKMIVNKFFVFLFSMPFIKVNNKKIVFDNFFGKGYGCNPKYIAEEIIREDIDCDMVWLVNDIETPMPSKIRKVKYGSIKSLFELATAKIWVNNVRNSEKVKKKKNQFYIQTWHSSLALKKIEGEVENMLSPQYVKEAKNDGKITDLMLANNTYTENLIRKYFWYDGNIMKVGLPRNDIMFKKEEKIIEKVYSYFNIERDIHFVIYTPTFRQNKEGIEFYKFDYDKVCNSLEKKFGCKYAVLLRLHPNVSKFKNELNYSDKVINASDYPDIQELLAVSDITITDYSSTMFDSSMFGKIVFILAKDLEEYKLTERETEFEITELPFSIATNDDDLCNNIDNFSFDKYKNNCDKFYDKIGLVNNNNASTEVVKIIKDKMNT